MEYRTRKLIKPEDLNARNTLFGGRLLQWIDEEVAIFVMNKLYSKSIVTKFMSEINFISSAKQGDVVEIGIKITAIGRTSITLACETRNIFTKKTIITIDKIVFVNIDEDETPCPHGLTMDNMN